MVYVNSRLSIDEDMERSFSCYISRAFVAERSQIEASEQRFAATKQHWPDGHVHFVD